MNNKAKNIVTTLTFSLFLAFFVALCIMKGISPAAYSDVEKRPLAQFPQNITVQTILNTKDPDKSTIKQFEKFSVDQFPFREFFRSMKAHFTLDVLRLNENNGYTVRDGSIIQVEQTFDEKRVGLSLDRLTFVYDRFLKDNGGKVFASVIPDKNFFLGRDYGYPVRDFGWLTQQVRAALPHARYVDIADTLELSDYYLTDWHWSQPNLLDTVSRLAQELGAGAIPQDYEQHTLEGFLGGYAAQSALYPKAEDLVYLTNEVLDQLTVFDYESSKTYGIYDMAQFEAGKEPYNFFLSGTRALLRIDNPMADSRKEIVVFRDSFGSSILPLLAQGYKSVYVVDIRYVMPQLLDKFIDFRNKDALFLYSATILEQAAFK